METYSIIMVLLTSIGGVMLGIISYFLKSTMSDLKNIKNVAYKNESDIKVIRNDYINKHTQVSDKLDMLEQLIDKKFCSIEDSLKDLSKDIKELNKKIK